ncbi:MAG: two-component sensor histidine kinase [Acidiferrobacteraceae bacterium]|nr:two-component sensor histidine kinase [Acidiferrobacteraceae bacterium]MDP6397920.1 ATP-binding protein [Arenicellales bacterium]MDP6550854.1 ATP-binding protein [Arenicellales bacterium]MDP6790770.1 ATP-binding protein [Arenicellales bacterium]MDP6917888.1 ATP-binding protein [Arenicellales bacterium]
MRTSRGFALTLTLSLALLGASVLLSQSAQDGDLFGDYYAALIILNAAGIAILALLTFFQVRKLVSAFRARALGSRLTVRFIATFAVLALVPLAMVYYFSVQFLSRSIDSWFGVRIEQALDDALLLGRSTLEATKLEVIRQARTAARRIELTTSSVQLYNLLDNIRAAGAFDEMSLHSSTGRILASSSNLSISLVPDAPGEEVLGKVRRDGVYAVFEPTDDEGLQLRVAVPVSGLSVSSPSRVLQILYSLPLRYSRLGESVESASTEYDRLKYLRGPLTLSFVLSLTLISLMTLLMALWASIYLAQRMLAPLRDLAKGTRAVSRGDYDMILPVESGDELGVLVDSFNRMTREIGTAQQTALESQRRAESEHAYLDTVLTHLSAGVLSFDGARRLQTCNTAAARILGADLNKSLGQRIDKLREALPGAAALVAAIEEGMDKHTPEWQREISVTGAEGRHILICSGTRVDSDDIDTGHVVVFEDATELLKAQRDAAWGEVAHRLAHEIKNPLTPIQLSAERIRSKYLSALDPEQCETLDRSTRTIVQQVEAMKAMVNAFSEYARPAPLQRVSTDLNQLINDTVELFRSGQSQIELRTEPDTRLERIQIDPNSFRQVLNNLVINAQDALAGGEGVVIIRTEQGSKTGPVTVTVQDNGPGFDPQRIDRVFEPYVSAKDKGTGLGLAICRRIIEEHGGSIRASNPQQGGAAVIISLPLRRQ